MQAHVKTCIKAVKEYCYPLQSSQDYVNLERKLRFKAEQCDQNGASLTEIYIAFAEYEKCLRQDFKKQFEKVERDKRYKDTRIHLTAPQLSGSAKDEKSPEAEDTKQRQPTREQNTPERGNSGGAVKDVKHGNRVSKSPNGGQQPNFDPKKKVLSKVNERKDEESRNSTSQPKAPGNGAHGKQGEDVTLFSDSSDAEEWRKKLIKKEDELNDLEKQLEYLAKECSIEGETPRTIIMGAITELKNQEKERKAQNQPKGKMKEIEDELEELKKLVFYVKKVKNSEHDFAKTKAKINDLHSQEEELMKLKQTVFKPNKGKDEVHSAEDTMKRVSELQSLEEEFLKLKRAAFKPNKGKDEVHSTEDIVKRMSELQSLEEDFLKLKRAAFKPNKGKEEVHSTEDTVKRMSELQSQEEELEKLKQFVFTPNKGKDVVHSAEDTVKRVSELQRCEAELLELKKITFDEELMNDAFGGKQNEYKHNVESARALVQNLKGARAELQRLLEAIIDSENPFTTDTAMKKVQQLKKSASEKEKKYNSLMRDKEDMARRMDIEINRLQRERDDLLKRFSKVAGAKLTDGNPNVTDLSDQNRPIKIGEQYSELYDNAWTDAFEKLTGEGKISERNSIQILLDILEDSYSTCKEIAVTRYRNILAELTLLKLAAPEDKPPNRNTPREKKAKQDESKDKVSSITSEVLKKVGLRGTDIKYIKDMLKITLEGTSQIVEQSVLKWLVRKEGRNDEQLKFAKPYVEKCARVCWLMVAQDPPVCLKPSEKKDNKFDKDTYREFTTSGKKIDYVVWPALLLHEGGPLLSKGVAQPKA